MGETSAAASSFSKCGECNRCRGLAWPLISVLKSRIIGESPADKENDVPFENAVINVAGSVSKLPQGQTQTTLPLTDQRMENCLRPPPRPSYVVMGNVIQQLQSLGTKCIICRRDEHYPNRCQPLIQACFKSKSIRKDACVSCFGTGHTVQEVGTRLKELNGGPKEDIVALKRKDQKLNDCAIVYQEHACYLRFKPCTYCWLQHDSREIGGDCATSRSTVRACFLLVWHAHQRAFLDLMTKSGALPATRRISKWSEFMQWGVYEGGDDLQNAYLVVSFVLGLK